MSVLARLVARATGQLAPGLAPRLPGRFETAPGAWGGSFEVQERNVTAPPPADATQRLRTEAPPPPPAPAAAKQNTESGSRRPQPLMPERTTAVDQAPLPPSDAASAETPRRAQPQAPDVAEPPPDHGVAPAKPAAEGVEAPGSRLRRAKPEGAPTHLSAEIVAAPEPLLPKASPTADRSGRSDPPHRVQSPPFQAPPYARSGRAAPAEPPEITVHIGRIDIVASPEEPKAPRRAKPRRPQMTELGDYLRGREGGK